jgi:hypothetical protein
LGINTTLPAPAPRVPSGGSQSSQQYGTQPNRPTGQPSASAATRNVRGLKKKSRTHPLTTTVRKAQANKHGRVALALVARLQDCTYPSLAMPVFWFFVFCCRWERSLHGGEGELWGGGRMCSRQSTASRSLRCGSAHGVELWCTLLLFMQSVHLHGYSVPVPHSRR